MDIIYALSIEMAILATAQISPTTKVKQSEILYSIFRFQERVG